MENLIGTEVDILVFLPRYLISVGVVDIEQIVLLIPVHLHILGEQRIQSQDGVLPIPDDLRVGIPPQ